MIRTTGLAFLAAVVLVGLGCAGGTGGGGAGAVADGAQDGTVTPPAAPPGPGDGEGDADEDTNDELPALTLTSQTVASGGAIPLEHAHDACGGDDVPPHLAWAHPPAETQSFLVILFDQDAGDFIHWVVFNIPASVLQIFEGSPVPGGETLNGYGLFGYGGPCPPPGEEHTYVFRVYALDIAAVGLTAGQAVTRTDVDAAIEGHVLDHGELTATYASP